MSIIRAHKNPISESELHYLFSQKSQKEIICLDLIIEPHWEADAIKGDSELAVRVYKDRFLAPLLKELSIPHNYLASEHSALINTTFMINGDFVKDYQAVFRKELKNWKVALEPSLISDLFSCVESDLYKRFHFYSQNTNFFRKKS